MKGWTGWDERHEKAQYPSWPDPVRELRCLKCPYHIELKKSGQGPLSHARGTMRAHVKTEHPEQYAEEK